MTEQIAQRHADPTRDATDVDVGLIIKTAVTLLVLLMDITAVLWGFFKFFVERPILGEPEPMPSAERLAGPRLQISPARDLNELQAAEDEALNSYGWVDRDNGIVRIPIERAMEVLVERERSKENAEQGEP